jgi:formylglycine-generating enzyme required for sulfatase activity
VKLWRPVKAGDFWMGSPEGEADRDEDEGPRHLVKIASLFRIGAVPVTNAQYRLFDPSHRPYRFEGVSTEELEHNPVANVTWYEAMAFCRWLGRVLPGAEGARLPTEAEWEYACRAGSETAYWSGDTVDDLERVGWFRENSEGRTHQVGEKPRNDFGLYDVHGNVLEWTLSRYKSSYAERATGVEEDPLSVNPDESAGDDPAGAGGGGRVMRGGSFWVGARWARSAYRVIWYPGFEIRDRGFRVVLPAAPSGRS